MDDGWMGVQMSEWVYVGRKRRERQKGKEDGQTKLGLGHGNRNDQRQMK